MILPRTAPVLQRGTGTICAPLQCGAVSAHAAQLQNTKALKALARVSHDTALRSSRLLLFVQFCGRYADGALKKSANSAARIARLVAKCAGRLQCWLA